jgi:hypothetical protein
VVYKSDKQVQKVWSMSTVTLFNLPEGCSICIQERKAHRQSERVQVDGVQRFFEAQLGSLVQAYEAHIEHLESLGWLCDKKRLKDLHDNLNTRYAATGQGGADNSEHFQRLDAAMDQLLKRDQEHQQQQEQRRKEKHKVALIDWLSSLSFRAAYDDRCDEHLDGIGSRLLSSETYKNWKTSDESDLL